MAFVTDFVLISPPNSIGSHAILCKSVGDGLIKQMLAAMTGLIGLA